MENNFNIGDKVQRIGSNKDYTTGRRGEVVELSKVDGPRVRVRWLFEKDGTPITTMGAKPGNGVRTWVAKKTLIKI